MSRISKQMVKITVFSKEKGTSKNCNIL